MTNPIGCKRSLLLPNLTGSCPAKCACKGGELHTPGRGNKGGLLKQFNPETCVKMLKMDSERIPRCLLRGASIRLPIPQFFLWMFNASLYKKLAGNFKAGLFPDLISSPGIRSSRDSKVLSVMFWNSIGKHNRLNQLMRL